MDPLLALFDSRAIGLFSAAVLVYTVGGIVFRLFLSPISHIPGPKTAAATFWYGIYYDVICKGQYVWKVEEMHKKYGPVVRINPDEVHIMEPDFYPRLYAGGREHRDKVLKHTRQFGMPDSMLFTVPQDVHRTRRAILNPFFSKASLYKLEPVIQDKVDEMLERMDEFRATGCSLPLFEMFAAYTNVFGTRGLDAARGTKDNLVADVVMEYAFARSDRKLAHPDFDPTWLRALVGANEMAHWMLHFHWAFAVLRSLPPWLAKLINPGLGRIFDFQEGIKSQIRDIQGGTNRSNEKLGTHRTIFHEVLDSDLPAAEKRLERMWQEGLIVVGAGTDTTAWTLVVALVHILLDNGVRRRLEAELRTAVTAPQSEHGPAARLHLKDLEKLPYLTACVKEALRLAYGLSARLPRLAPNQALEVPGSEGLVIPAGTKMSMNAVLMHRHPRLFPQPDRFRPDRWLENPGLDAYLVSFSKGARQCLGLNLAYAELYMALGAVFDRFAATVDEYDEHRPCLQLLHGNRTLDDVTISGDMFLPSVKSGNKDIRVVWA